MGNSLKAWAYSAFNAVETSTNNHVTGDMDLHSASPESYQPGRFLEYELPRRGLGRTIVFKVQSLLLIWATRPQDTLWQFQDRAYDQIIPQAADIVWLRS